MSKGSNPRPYSVGLKTFDENFDKIFKKEKVKGGKYRYDEETRKMLPLYDWYEKNGWPEEKPRTAYIQGDIEPYESMVTGRIISSRKEHRDELERTGCRVYEGREQEEKEAARYRAQKDKEFEDFLGDALEETHNQLKNGMIKPETSIKSQWLLGED